LIVIPAGVYDAERNFGATCRIRDLDMSAASQPTAPGSKKIVIDIDLEDFAFAPFPIAVKAGGLVFTSGQRGAASGFGFRDLPPEGRSKEQGFGAIDTCEGEVAASSWKAHAALDVALKAAGSDTDQILRQHVWQRDKRYFPVYEAVRKHWQPTPAPSSGLGVGALGGIARPWIGLDAIAVETNVSSIFTNRTVVAAVDHKALPSASHYSQAVRSGPLVFTAGHIPIKTSEPGKPVVKSFDDVPEEGRFLATGRSHPDSRDGPIAAQTWFVYSELRKLLAQAGLSLSDTVLSSVFLADLRDLAVFHRIHRHFFPEGGPALSISGFDEVGHRGCGIEIELTALDPKGGVARSDIPWSIAPPFAAPAGVRVGDFVFFSAVAGFDRDARLVALASELPSEARALVTRSAEYETANGIAAQGWAAFARLGEALSSAGAGFESLVKLTIYLQDEADLAIVERIAFEFLPRASLPAIEHVIVHGPGPGPDSRIQLEAIAFSPPGATK
jgi:enamine deaminase RidA (YjgF/YER057c/UK114 family)